MQILKCIIIFFRGETFRPEYLKVGRLQATFDCPVLALTGTATVELKQDVFQILGLDEKCHIVATLPDRPNVKLDFRKATENFEEELEFLLKRIEMNFMKPKKH
jgi:superfamily II DNA helicase RecQ